MGRTRASMTVLAGRFKKAGYKTLNFPYGQAVSSLDEITKSFRAFLDKRVETPRYHLVAHSLGNIVIRNALRTGVRPGLGRIVMLAPPNRPARLAKLLKDRGLYRWIMGDSGQKLADDEFYAKLPVPSSDFAVIAGDKGQSLTFKEPNDGIVEVEGTKLEGMKDFAVVHHTHTFMMNAGDTFRLAKHFLETGEFQLEKSRRDQPEP
jgi:triacylglycerol lipase